MPPRPTSKIGEKRRKKLTCQHVRKYWALIIILQGATQFNDRKSGIKQATHTLQKMFVNSVQKKPALFCCIFPVYCALELGIQF